MRTRCPACSTVFRATSEQLRLKAGKVRCGHCQSVFNAFDHLIGDESSETVSASKPAAEVANRVLAVPPVVDHPEQAGASAGFAALEIHSVAQQSPELVATEVAAAPVRAAREIELAPDVRKPSVAAYSDPSQRLQETAEQSTEAARAAGLVAARELIDTKSYNRWAAGTLADGSLGSFGDDARRRVLWPFVVFSGLLLLALAAQLAYFYRTDVVRHVAAADSIFKLAGIEVPLSKDPDLVAIEASDLQSDAARGLLVLQAGLANRAAFAQAWPSLELTLTDVGDAVVSRRVLGPNEYLPYAEVPETFPAKSEVAVKLWIEAKEIGAAGYRLYVFYP